MTTVGFILLAALFGMIAFAALRLTPIYLNYMKVSGVLSGVHDEFDGKAPTRGAIRTSVQRRFDVESVSVISARDVSITPVDAGFQVAADYDHTAPFIGNISFTVHFEKETLVRR